MKCRPRWQEVKYTRSGRPFLMHYRMRVYLDEVMRAEQLIVKDGFTAHGVFGISNNTSLGVELDDANGLARVRYL